MKCQDTLKLDRRKLSTQKGMIKLYSLCCQGNETPRLWYVVMNIMPWSEWCSKAIFITTLMQDNFLRKIGGQVYMKMWGKQINYAQENVLGC